MGGRRRQLTEEEETLWDGVARTVAPLKPGAKSRRPAPAAKPKSPVAADAKAKSAPPEVPKPRVRPPPPSPAPLDRRTLSRLSRGNLSIDGRLDLHGLTQEAAHDRLIGFLLRVQGEGGRTVLVITGKGDDSGPHDRGVLRRAVPMWLASRPFRGLVVGFDEAGRHHGGAGALYVRIKKKR